MSGSDVLVRVAGRAVIREICVARVPRQRCCSHVVDISQTDIVVAIDVFSYVTRTHTHSHASKQRKKPNEMKFNTNRSTLWLSASLRWIRKVPSHCCRSKFRLRSRCHWTHQKRGKSTKTAKINWILDDVALEVNTVAFIVENFDIYYALLCWIIDVNPINKQIANTLSSHPPSTPPWALNTFCGTEDR